MVVLAEASGGPGSFRGVFKKKPRSLHPECFLYPPKVQGGAPPVMFVALKTIVSIDISTIKPSYWSRDGIHLPIISHF